MLAALTHADHLSGDPEILSSAGKVFFPDDIEIRDDNGHVVPEGEAGEIFLRGKYTQAALWTREHTMKSLVGPDGWLATTDCGRIIDQRLWITGRKRDMILYRGYNVTSRSIEESLQNHAAVADAVVHPVHDDYSGEAVFAWVRPAEGAVLDLEALCDQVEKDLGSWSRPKYIEVIDEIPLVPNALQKFDKVVLRERAEKLIAERETPGE